MVYIKTDSFEYHLTAINDVDVSEITSAVCYSDVSVENGGVIKVIVLK